MIKSFKQFNEQRDKEVFFSFGRFNPPTTGHQKLMDKIASVARGKEYKIYASNSVDPKKNPLQYKEKVTFMRKMFPKHARNIMMSPKIKTVFDIATELQKDGYNKVTMVVGGDRVKEFDSLLKKYNGVKGRHGFYDFSTIDVVSAGERDPDAQDVTGMSASKMRQAAMDGDFKSFQGGLPKGYSDGTKLFNTLRKRMGLKEVTDFREHIQLEKVSEKRESYARGEIFNRGDYAYTSLNEKILIKERKPNYIIATGGKKYWIDELSEKIRRTAQDKDVEDKKGTQPKKYYSGIKSKSTKDKRDAHFKKGAAKSDDDPSAYKPAPGDARAKTKPSKHTKKFKQMYGEKDNPRIPRKKGQPAGSDKHSDLYTDENPKGTIHGLGFKDTKTAEASIKKIENSGKSHAHKIQAAIAMEQRAKVMGKKGPAAVYRKYIEKMKKITKQKNESLQEDTLMEKLITFAGKAYPQQGNALILAGGAGSGKGFVLDNLIGLEGKVFNVDDLKSAVIRTPKIVKKIKDKLDIDMSKMDLKKGEDVAKLHDIVANELKLSNKQQIAFFANALFQTDDLKPNVIFDVTLKDLTKLDNITRMVQSVGYNKKKIHIVWVINDVEVAKKQNLDPKRGRVVPVEILINTHRGASQTMLDIVKMGKGLRKYMDGDIVFTFNKAKIDGSLERSGRGGEMLKDPQFLYVKRSGKAPTPVARLGKDILDKISSYVPNADTWSVTENLDSHLLKSFKEILDYPSDKTTEKYKEQTPGEDVDEKLDPKKDDAGDYVKDFQKSDAPQFKGKSKKKRQQMAIAAYLDAKDKMDEGKGKKKGKPESFEKQFDRRVVKTTKPEHKEKGYNWRIKGKDRPEVTIKLYKTKPDYKEFVKQLKRVAGHEFG